jgi:hypothetical protein
MQASLDLALAPTSSAIRLKVPLQRGEGSGIHGEAATAASTSATLSGKHTRYRDVASHGSAGAAVELLRELELDSNLGFITEGESRRGMSPARAAPKRTEHMNEEFRCFAVPLGYIPPLPAHTAATAIYTPRQRQNPPTVAAPSSPLGRPGC